MCIRDSYHKARQEEGEEEENSTEDTEYRYPGPKPTFPGFFENLPVIKQAHDPSDSGIFPECPEYFFETQERVHRQHIFFFKGDNQLFIAAEFIDPGEVLIIGRAVGKEEFSQGG